MQTVDLTSTTYYLETTIDNIKFSGEANVFGKRIHIEKVKSYDGRYKSMAQKLRENYRQRAMDEMLLFVKQLVSFREVVMGEG